MMIYFLTCSFRPDSEICAEFEVEVTTIPASPKPQSITLSALPCASLLLLLRGSSVSSEGHYIPEGSVLFLSANLSLDVIVDELMSILHNSNSDQ